MIRAKFNPQPNQFYICPICEQSKIGTEFYSGNRSIRKCKKCRYAHIKAWREAIKTNNPEHHKRLVKKRAAYAAYKNYGLTLEQYETMIKNQNNHCYICNKPSNKRLFIDHCHETGKVRALLCYKCNTVLGMSGDSLNVLKNAISYLRQFS